MYGNFIGVDVTGTATFSNSAAIGISSGASNNMIGLPGGLGNVISANGHGVTIDGVGTDGNSVRNNLIGTDRTGVNPLGVRLSGVLVNNGAQNNIIGDSGSGNVVAASGEEGMTISGNGTSGNMIRGNSIGTDPTGTIDLGNGGRGIVVFGANDNTIEANTIAFNGDSAIDLVVSATGTLIIRNSMHSNSSLGIDLNDDGVTPNNQGDVDSGPNGRQNYSVLTAAIPGSITKEGSLNSGPSADYRVDFYSNTECDQSNFGEGETYIGTVIVTTDAGGDADFGITLPEPARITARPSSPSSPSASR